MEAPTGTERRQENPRELFSREWLPASTKIVASCWKKPVLHQSDIEVTAVYFKCVLEGVRQAEKAGVAPDQT